LQWVGNWFPKKRWERKLPLKSKGGKERLGELPVGHNATDIPSSK